MRLAIVADIHGNLTALRAVVADIEKARPDLVLQGGDIAVTGPNPAEVVDLVRELGWAGVMGNVDELLWRADLREETIASAPKLEPWLNVLFNVLRPWTAERLGEGRIAWMRSLPLTYRVKDLLLQHASARNLWRAPYPDASEDELLGAFEFDAASTAVYGHIHRPFVRQVGYKTIANTGSVGLSWDGDWRASYLLVEDGEVTIRRVEYDLDRDEAETKRAGFPLPGWLSAVHRTGRFHQPG